MGLGATPAATPGRRAPAAHGTGASWAGRACHTSMHARKRNTGPMQQRRAKKTRAFRYGWPSLRPTSNLNRLSSCGSAPSSRAVKHDNRLSLTSLCAEQPCENLPCSGRSGTGDRPRGAGNTNQMQAVVQARLRPAWAGLRQTHHQSGSSQTARPAAQSTFRRRCAPAAARMEQHTACPQCMSPRPALLHPPSISACCVTADLPSTHRGRLCIRLIAR